MQCSRGVFLSNRIHPAPTCDTSEIFVFPETDVHQTFMQQNTSTHFFRLLAGKNSLWESYIVSVNLICEGLLHTKHKDFIFYKWCQTDPEVEFFVLRGLILSFSVHFKQTFSCLLFIVCVKSLYCQDSMGDLSSNRTVYLLRFSGVCCWDFSLHHNTMELHGM